MLVQYIMFAVDETPFCLWDHDLNQTNLEFIGSIDPGYFRYVADQHAQALELEERKQYAALSLRTAYSHGLETLFALLFAAIQAPECVAGWLLKYELKHIRSLLTKVRGRQPILSRLAIRPATWESISTAIHYALELDDKEKEASIRKGFAHAWDHFADDFLDLSNDREYNSAKHGLRIKPGGNTFSLGREEVPGVAASPHNMKIVGHSDFGSSFFFCEKIGENKQHIRVKHCRRNWQPDRFINALYVISYSLQNILTFLMMHDATEPTNLVFSYPIDDSLFEAAWRSHPGNGISEMSFGSTVTCDDIKAFSKDDILATYRLE